MSTDARVRAVADHRSTWGEPDLVVRAPGRVNLIGEHTDYNDGFVFPMALPFDTVIAVSASTGPSTEIRSEGFGAFSFDGAIPEWAVHMQVMQELMAADGIVAPPWRGTVATDIPTGASLSSSAAIEVAVGLVIATLAGADVDGPALARYGQRAETKLMDAPTGIMDQLISATAVAGSASLIDCRSLDITPYPVPADATVVVMDTMTRRELLESEYGDRSSTCFRAAELLGVAALRDVPDVAALAAIAQDHPLEFQRASHVVAEDARTLAAADAMAAGDAVALGALMDASHESLRDLYEVSGPALDRIVEIAKDAPGCFGARMTGGGFAGCAVALVDRGDVGSFTAAVDAAYTEWYGSAPRLWVCAPSAGASVEDHR